MSGFWKSHVHKRAQIPEDLIFLLALLAFFLIEFYFKLLNISVFTINNQPCLMAYQYQ